jgi:FixJ family two-component response regulator
LDHSAIFLLIAGTYTPFALVNLRGVNNRANSRNDARSRRQAPSSAMFSEQVWAEIGLSLGLSLRELQILRGIFDNRTEFTITADLGISLHAVYTQMERRCRI